jgi:hypothetical protein
VRALFLLLLLANLLFLAWTQWVATPIAMPTAAPVTLGADAPPIRLQQEVEATRNASPTTQVPESPEAPLSALCVSIGPFLEQARAEAASAQLQRLGFAARLRASVDEVRVGLWVRVTSLATPEDAANALAALQAAGLTDAYVLGNDEAPGNTVSLGVFGDRGRAEEVSARVRRAGFIPETSDRLRTMDVFWLDIDREANGSLPSLEVLTGTTKDGSPLEMRACPAVAAVSGAASAG